MAEYTGVPGKLLVLVAWRFRAESTQFGQVWIQRPEDPKISRKQPTSVKDDVSFNSANPTLPRA